MEERQRFEILLEDMNSKIGIIADGHSLLLRQIEVSREEVKRDNQETRMLLTASVNRLDKKIDGVKQELKQELKETRKELGGKIDRVAEIVKDHSQRISRLEEKVLIN